ncbi:hypothetical protein, partial [Bizionia gelidisalsuginis]|uniref:hypothetical protein n=1 Tax=Bizionia gelidisalsuginis TaxID=291188 RepID=UPI0014783F62
EISGESPLSQTLCSGATPEDLSFITDSGGTGTIIYQWYASDDIIIDASDAAVGTNTTVFNPGVQSPGTYYYYVTVDVDESLGCADVSSAIFTIEVIEDPEVVITPSEQTICTGVSADLLVAQVTGGLDLNADGSIDTADYNFQWYLNGTPVSEINDADGNTSTFNHDNSLPAGVYTYYCEISQPNAYDCNATSNPVTITVNEGPS